VYVRVVECDRFPAVPVTVTTYWPIEPLQEMVEVADEPRVTLMSLNEHEICGEDVAACRVTVPVNPFRLVRVMVEEPDSPPWMVTVDGLDDMLKSAGELVQMFVLANTIE